jgi:RNA polymerase sigma factor (sigma-70 family)
VETGGHDAIVEGLRRRDEASLSKLIDEFGPLVLGVARRIVAEPFLAEEVAQDTFLTLWRRPERFDSGRGSLQTFLPSVARNKAIDLVRRENSLRRTAEALRRSRTADHPNPRPNPSSARPEHEPWPSARLPVFARRE